MSHSKSGGSIIIAKKMEIKNLISECTAYDFKLMLEEKKPKTKGITRNVRIAINTINQAVEMITKTGIPVNVQQEEDETEVRMILRFPK